MVVPSGRDPSDAPGARAPDAPGARAPDAPGAPTRWRPTRAELRTRLWARLGLAVPTSGVAAGALSDADTYVLVVWASLALRLLQMAGVSLALWLAARPGGLPRGLAAAWGLLTLSSLVQAVRLVSRLRGRRSGRDGTPVGGIPGDALLVSGAALDVLWTVGGYAITGLGAFPFPVLLVGVLGLQGVLLPAAWVFLFALAGGTGMALLQATTLTLVRAPVLGPMMQLVVIGTLGGLVGILGNRLRAAAWAVSRLVASTTRLAEHQHDTLAHLPIGVAFLDAQGQVVEATGQLTAGDDLVVEDDGGARAPVRRELTQLLDTLRSHDPGFAAALLGAMEPEAAPPDAAGATPAGARPGPGRPETPGTRTGTREVETQRGRRTVEWTVAARDIPDLTRLDRAALTAGSSGLPSEVPAVPTVRRTVVVVRDRTDAARAASAAEAAREARGLADMAAALAHELRNPLAALRSSCEQLVATGAQLEAEDRQLLGRVVLRESDRLNRQVSDFLDYARLGHAAGPVGAAGVTITDTVDLVRRSHPSATLRVEVRGPTPPMDATLLGRVLGNLLTNAVALSPPGAVVQVDAGWQDEDWVLSVTDAGPGVALADRRRIFLPFYTRRRGGTGLGLSIAARSADLLGGHLEAQTPPGASETGAGARFEFRVHPEVGRPARPAVSSGPGSSGPASDIL